MPSKNSQPGCRSMLSAMITNWNWNSSVLTSDDTQNWAHTSLLNYICVANRQIGAREPEYRVIGDPYLPVTSRDPATVWTKRRVKKALTMAMFTCKETGSSNNAAVDWDSSSKFSTRLDSDIRKWVPSLKPKPEVDFRLYGRHLEKSIWRHNSVADSP